MVSTPARLGALALALCAAPAHAQTQDRELSYSIGVGAEYSDNIARVPDFETADTIASVDLALELKRSSSRLDAEMSTDLAYNEYLDDSFDSEVVGNALIDLEAHIVRNRLSWFARDNFGQLRQQVLNPDTPDNRENVNVFSTGPRFTQRLGSRSSLILEGLYEVETYEVSPLDAKRTGGDLSLHRDLSPRQFVELTAATRETRFDEGGTADDYTIDEYFLSWSATGAKTELNIDVGQSQVDGAGRDDSQGLLRFDARRKIGSYGALSLTARSQTVSAAEAFRFEQGAGEATIGTQSRAAVGEPVDIEYVGLGYELAARRASVSFDVSKERNRYEFASENDSDRKSATLSANWFVNARWTLGAEVETAKETYPVLDASFRELSYAVDASADLTRTLSLRFLVSSIDRSGAVGTNAYDELRAKVSLVYSGGNR